MWQKCPICNGTGVSPMSGTYTSIPTCPTCQGARIISEINGLPPSSTSIPSIKSSSTINKMNPFVGDFRDAQIFEVKEYPMTDVQYYNETYGGQDE